MRLKKGIDNSPDGMTRHR